MTVNLCEPSKSLTYASTSDLRLSTQSAHQAVERALSLPSSIHDIADYRSWLARFYGMYVPLELRLAEYGEWLDWGIRLGELGHSESLRCDLKALGTPMQDLELAPREALPELDSFGAAFGALYVIEGSKLGGGFMLKDLSARLSPHIDEASAFFRGYGAAAGPKWNGFKERLDHFLALRPFDFQSVTDGAEATFASVRHWMTPLT